MKTAIIGSRTLSVDNLEKYLPDCVTAIISGGAVGVDTSARKYAQAHAIPIIEFLPDYAKYGRGAPIRRNILIADSADLVIAFWDGKSHGTRFVIDYCRRKGIPLRIYLSCADGFTEFGL